MKLLLIVIISTAGFSKERGLPKTPQFMIKAKAEVKKDKITQLNEQTMVLEKQVQELAQSVQAQKDLIDQRLRSDHRMRIQFRMPETFDLHQMTIILDDFPIYEIESAHEFVESYRTFGIYDGPVSPGPHILKVHLRATKDRVHYQEQDKIFTLQIPSEPSQRSVVLQPKWNQDGTIDIQMDEEKNEN